MRIFAEKLKTDETMNSKILKLDAPYNVIYAGGKIGRHIATLMTWEDDVDGEAGVFKAKQYPIIDQGDEFPAGMLVWEAELEDCRVLCPYSRETQCNGTNLYWFAKMVEYDFQQLEPVGIEFMGERLKRLGCVVRFPNSKEKWDDGTPKPQMDFEATLSIFSPQGSWKEHREYQVKSNPHEGLYFEAYGTEEVVYNDLHYQLMQYYSVFGDDLLSVKFRTHDMELGDVIKKLNEATRW